MPLPVSAGDNSHSLRLPVIVNIYISPTQHAEEALLVLSLLSLFCFAHFLGMASPIYTVLVGCISSFTLSLTYYYYFYTFEVVKQTPQ